MRKLVWSFVLFITFFTTVLEAKNTFRVFGGVNYSNIHYKSDSHYDFVDCKTKKGKSLGLEVSNDFITFGVAFQEFGTIIKGKYYFIDDSIDTFKYYTIYSMFSQEFTTRIMLMEGFQIAKGIEGSNKQNSYNYNIKSDKMKIDYGILVGGEYRFWSLLGVRATYYYGLADVIIEDHKIFTNRSINIYLTCRFDLTKLALNFLLLSVRAWLMSPL